VESLRGSQGRYEGIRERFTALDRTLFELNGTAIAASLCAVTVPEGIGYGRAADYTEKCLLDREANKKARHIPVRQLIRRAKNALQALKPCFLMSPMSAAQYLPPGEIEFDLVVMDEASQIRPEEALGAIARARRVVIVGDPKQLPPTRFFDSSVDRHEEAPETNLDDTESILDVCLKQLPYRRLRWHYRSQHESLIQFSNEKFYDGDLVVFPSPKRESRDYGVHTNFVENPSYKTGRNRAQVAVVVEHVVQHFRRWPDRSPGVATFNKRQAEEIELVLEHDRREHPDLDDLIANHQATEPLFIKNLENVQGDERDAMFLSTTYGPETPRGPVFQRYGPINSALGWSRLNVIATRARQRVEVFTSMRPSDIRIGDGCHPGVRAFRDYLENAETRRMTEHCSFSGRAPDSEFEVAVMKLVGDLGYECVPQVGVAGFFIDIGVVHPDRSSEFLMGVECDGAAYHSSRSVRDRDRLRQEILEGKGWSIHRIWSTSWFHARSAEIDRLRREIEERLREDRARYVPPPPETVEMEEVAISVISDRTDARPALAAAPALATADAAEAEFENESLYEALERYWEYNIRPEFPDRSRSILAEEAKTYIVRDKPYTEDMWFRSVPVRVRTKMDGRERQQFLDDMSKLVMQYT
jgi:very-short-patch-repair endonuclease